MRLYCKCLKDDWLIYAIIVHLLGIDDTNADICRIAENHLKKVIRDVNACLDIYSFSFGDLGADSIKSIKFTITVLKTGLSGYDFINYIEDNTSCVLRSNILTSTA